MFQSRSPPQLQAVQAAVASVAGQQQTVDAIGDFYQKGVTDAMRIYQENATDDPYKKRFTDVPKGSVMGWCGVTSWAQVPKIWREIENSKSEGERSSTAGALITRGQEDQPACKTDIQEGL